MVCIVEISNSCIPYAAYLRKQKRCNLQARERFIQKRKGDCINPYVRDNITESRLNFEYVNFSSIDSTGARYNISYDRFDGDCFALGTWQTKYYSIKYAHREFWDPLDPELIYEGNTFLILHIEIFSSVSALAFTLMGFQTDTSSMAL